VISFKKHKRFEKAYRKLSTKLQEKTSEVLTLFVQDRYNPKLNNHALK